MVCLYIGYLNIYIYIYIMSTIYIKELKVTDFLVDINNNIYNNNNIYQIKILRK